MLEVRFCCEPQTLLALRHFSPPLFDDRRKCDEAKSDHFMIDRRRRPNLFVLARHGISGDAASQVGDKVSHVN